MTLAQSYPVPMNVIDPLRPVGGCRNGDCKNGTERLSFVVDLAAVLIATLVFLFIELRAELGE